jgi:hypothetical protein
MHLELFSEAFWAAKNLALGKNAGAFFLRGPCKKCAIVKKTLYSDFTIVEPARIRRTSEGFKPLTWRARVKSISLFSFSCHQVRKQFMELKSSLKGYRVAVKAGAKSLNSLEDTRLGDTNKTPFDDKGRGLTLIAETPLTPVG